MSTPIYALFAGSHYYPNGGVADFVDTADSIDRLEEAAGDGHEWAHIVNLSTMKMVRHQVNEGGRFGPHAGWADGPDPDLFMYEDPYS